jgi:Mg2+ and Co2+ transporter CorA
MRFTLTLLILFLAQGCVEKQSSLSTPIYNTTSSKHCISEEALFKKSYAELAKVANSIEKEKATLDEFKDFVAIMKHYVSDYANVIEASSYFTQALRILPIPYAGEVANATRIISSSLVTLNETASTLEKYQNSSVNFLNGFNQLKQKPTLPALEQLSQYADNVLIVNSLELQANMKKMGKTTENLLYVNKLIADASTSTSSFFDNIKDFVGMSPSQREKELIEDSDSEFKSKLSELNHHITVLKNSASINRQSIAKSRVISDLAVEVSRAGR